MNTDRFIVHNMKCMGCANIIKSGLSQVDGVSEIYIDITKSEVTVNYSAEKVNHDEIAKKLGLLGYPVNPNV